MKRVHITATPDLLSTGEAAELLRISRSTLRRCVALGEIEASMTPGRHLRFDPDEVERFRRDLAHGVPSPSTLAH